MKIVIVDATLEDTKWYPIFDVLLLLVEEKRHSFAAEYLDNLLSSNWVKQRSHSDRDLIRLSPVQQSTDSLAHQSTVTVDADCRRGGVLNFENFNTVLHPLDAISFLSLPFQIVLENEWYDGAFLLWMARAIGFAKFLESHTDRRFQFRHAGGKGSLARSAEILSKGVWPRKDGAHAQARRLWTCAILDGDSSYPGDDPNAVYRASIEPHVVFLKQLKRRSIENYVPKDFFFKLEASAGFKQRVEALFRFTDQQRTHYHMKNGFRLSENQSPTKAEYLAAHIPNEEKELFREVDDKDWSLVRGGFGRGLSQLYVEEQYRPNWNDARLVNADDRAEIKSILEEIYKRL